MSKLLAAVRAHGGKFACASAGCTVAGLELYRRMHTVESDPAAACHYPRLRQLITANHVSELQRHGFVVLRDEAWLVPAEVIRGARSELSSYFYFGWFSRLGLNSEAVRNDMVCWLREADDSPQTPIGSNMLECMRALRGIVDALEAHGYAGSHTHFVPTQLQLGFYPGDSVSRYVRHSDHNSASIRETGLLKWLRASNRRNRSLTVILYLNETTWSSCDGGALRCYHDAPAEPADGQQGTPPESYTDVVPRGGTLVIFDARRIEHEVLPGCRDRFALSCWITGSAA
eukprot:gb/GFBE01083183.1/.p1 GENE.gb/GFBE01083183.1/~~gb/GFBE01083183.1/.p1  ORF type:complete len:287 (+),score=47.77 gb/GFBE01083183.1/:1-861(+)